MSAAGRLKSFKKLLAHACDILKLDVGFHMWDGSTVPEDLAADAFAIRFADEGVVAALMRKPSMERLLNLWVSGRVDLVNGDMFDLVERRPGVRTREIRKSLSKFMLANTARKFLFVNRGGPWPLEDQPNEKPSSGDPVENERNIAYHYDLSNAFYRLFLDDDMVYTCGYATDWKDDIDRMQANKLEHICRKLRLRPGETLLDIGSGWGSLACYAAKNYGVNALGVTLSREQLDFARDKAKSLGLEDRCRFEFTDYAAVDGKFDKITSVGFFEAIGVDNFATYYDTVRRVMNPDGLFLHHAITRPAKPNMRQFRRKNEEFALLTKYIFPGGELDHIGNTVSMMELHGFEVHDVENLREHYQRTCRLWHDRLRARYDEAVAEVGEVKTRLWLVYLGGCSVAFERNTVRLYQTLASHKRKGASGLPPTRADIYR